MTQPGEPIDLLLDAFVRAWHAGEAPDPRAFVARAREAERDELEQLLAAFAEIAPTVEPSPQRAAQLAADPRIARLSAIEADWWRAQGRDAEAREIEALAAALAAGEADDTGTQEAPFGARLKALRETAGVTLAGLGAEFAARFGLSAGDSARAPVVLGALESGELGPAGVAARAARALEELLAAPRGTLTPGPSPALGNVLLRAALPEDADQSEQFGELLRDVDDALRSGAPANQPSDTLQSLLGG